MSARLLRACAQAHPRPERAVVLALAEELVQDGAPLRREAFSLVASGVAARCRLAGAPWGEALGRLALPLAAFFLATLVLGGTRAPGWIGWSWTGGIAGAALAFAGSALGRRAIALPGALLVAGLCLADGAREQTRWIAAFVDVLPALACPALLLVAATLAGPRRSSLRRAAWAGASAAALVVVAVLLDFHTTAGTTVLVAGGGLVLAFTARALRGSRTDRLAAALLALAATPTAAWIIVAAAPRTDSDLVAWTLLLGLLAAGAGAAHRLATR